MHNELRAALDDGLQTLRPKQGASGWPAVPNDAVAPPPRPVMVDAPVPNNKAEGLLEAQEQDAKQQEKAFLQAALANAQ